MSHRAAVDSELNAEATRLRQWLRALRTRFPGLALHTSLTHIHDEQVVLRAELTLPDGTSLSAHAAEPTDGNGLLDTAIELAEQRAITRVFELIGIGDVPAGSTRPEPAPPPERPRREEATPSVVDALHKAQQARPAAPEPAVTEPASAPSVEEPEPASQPEPDEDMADYGWTDFWKWARANNLNAKGQVEQRIGRSMEGLQPREVRQLLFNAGIPR